MESRENSKKIFQSMCQVIPGGANSPLRACKTVGHLPMIVDRAEGPLLFDVDERSYIDYCCSWGALIHGHAHPQILEAVSTRMKKGTSFGISTPIEWELAEKIVADMESIEKIRFVSSGTEATMSAARLARGFTGRDVIVKFIGNYHGHADFFLVQAGSGLVEISSASSQGIPVEMVKNTINLPYNDISTCKSIFENPHYQNRIAAVILEPVAGNMGVVPASPEFIKFLREATQKIGALLIFDEVMTGFRVSKTGAQGYYQVDPDLTCFGKIVGGGFPAAAFGGKREIMDCLAPLGAVYQAGTLSGNPVAMEAGLQSLRLLSAPGFYEKLEKKAERLLAPIQKKIEENEWNICIQRKGSMFTIFFGKKEVRNFEEALQTDAQMFAKYFAYLFSKGIYMCPLQQEACFISAAHEDYHLDQTAETILHFMQENYG